MPQLRGGHTRQRAPRGGVDRHGQQELASIRNPTHYEEVSTLPGEAQTANTIITTTTTTDSTSPSVTDTPARGPALPRAHIGRLASNPI